MGNTESIDKDDMSSLSENDFYEKSRETNTKRVEQMLSIQNEAIELFKRKNEDYGDAFAEYGITGVLVRLGDKIQRFVSVSKKGISLVTDEKMRDTLIDLSNYATMAVMLMDEENDHDIENDDDFDSVDEVTE